MRYLLPAILLITGCAVDEDPALTLNIDKNRVTTSGVSAGAHMAHQLHIAYSAYGSRCEWQTCFYTTAYWDVSSGNCLVWLFGCFSV